MNKETRKSFKITLEGKNAHPELFSLNETYYLLKDIQDAIKAESENPNENTNIYLTNIKDNCITYNIEYETEYATKILNSLKGSYYADLRHSTVKHLQSFKRKIVKKNVRSIFIQKNEKIAEIGKGIDILIKDVEIKGMTTIYGEVERVGGKEPTVKLKLLSGKSMTVDTNRELAKIISKRLYTLTGFIGTATWNKLNKELISFKISDIVEYEEVPYRQTFNEIRDILSDDLDEFNNYNDLLFKD